MVETQGTLSFGGVALFMVLDPSEAMNVWLP